jgi:hypothetical protein
MAKTHRLSLGTRLIDTLFRLITRLGLGASYRHILTVPGGKTGRLYSTPVDLIEVDGFRWLVAGLRSRQLGAEHPRCGRGHAQPRPAHHKFKVEEAEVEAAVPVLRKYIAEIRVTRPYFNANPDSSDEAIAAELERHTVLRLIPVS